MAVVRNNKFACKTKTPDDNKTNNILKILTATELEIKYARHLADNDPKVRKGALKVLKRWFMKRGCVLDKDFNILWSGLYITFWMSDKPLVQEECAENIASLSNVLNSAMALKFFESAFSRLSMEWFGIDQLRMDKFLMLVRRLLRKCLQVLATAEYNVDVMSQYKEIITNILYTGDFVNNLGLKLHLADIYLEEISKTQSNKLEPAVVTQLLQPFVYTLCVGKDGRLLSHIANQVFRQLMRQSDEGLDFADKYKVWRQMGFPGGDISYMQLSKDGLEDDDDHDDDEHDEDDARDRVLDPRAGRVNVNLPQIRFDSREISDLLDNSKFDPKATSKNRKIVNKLINDFRSLATGEFPLNKNQRTVELLQKEKGKIKRSANALIDLEEKIRNDSNKNRKRKKESSSSADETVRKRLKQNEESHVDNNTIVLQNNIKYFEPKTKCVNGAVKLRADCLKTYINSKNGRKIKSDVHLDIEACNYECKFKRPSGTWYVFKGPVSPTKVKSTKVGNNVYIENDNTAQGFIIGDSDATPSRTVGSQFKFKSEALEGTVLCTKGDFNSFTTSFATIKKGEKSAETTMRVEGSRIKVVNKPETIITSQDEMLKQISQTLFSTRKNKTPIKRNNLIQSSEKKVKIALNLNKSQEIHEHELQVKTSPAIPFDANRKPIKPLLKPQCGRFSMSPINPFAKLRKQRRSLMF